ARGGRAGGADPLVGIEVVHGAAGRSGGDAGDGRAVLPLRRRGAGGREGGAARALSHPRAGTGGRESPRRGRAPPELRRGGNADILPPGGGPRAGGGAAPAPP